MCIRIIFVFFLNEKKKKKKVLIVLILVSKIYILSPKLNWLKNFSSQVAQLLQFLLSTSSLLSIFRDKCSFIGQTRVSYSYSIFTIVVHFICLDWNKILINWYTFHQIWRLFLLGTSFLEKFILIKNISTEFVKCVRPKTK